MKITDYNGFRDIELEDEDKTWLRICFVDADGNGPNQNYVQVMICQDWGGEVTFRDGEKVDTDFRLWTPEQVRVFRQDVTRACDEFDRATGADTR